MTTPPRTTEQERALAEAERLTLDRSVAGAALASVTAEHKKAVEQCIRLAVPMSHLADLAHVSRETLYVWKRQLDAPAPSTRKE